MAVNAFDYCRVTKQRVQAQRTINAKLFKKGTEAAQTNCPSPAWELTGAKSRKQVCPLGAPIFRPNSQGESIAGGRSCLTAIGAAYHKTKPTAASSRSRCGAALAQI